MNRRAIKRIKIGLLFFPLLFVLSFCQNNANAEMISSDNLYKMSLLTSIRECYYNYAKNPLSIYNLGSSWENFFDTSGDWDKTNSQEVWISTHIGNTLKSTHSGDTWERDSNLSCEQLFKGYSGQGEAKGLFQLFQIPEIKSTNMAAWGYRLIGSTAPPPSEEPTTNENKVKITITDIKSLDGNKNPITASGEIICNGIPGNLTSVGKGQYNWILNCEGEIDTYLHRGNEKTLIYVVKATYSNGRKWRAAAFDGFSDFDEWAPPSYDCYSDKKDECRYLSYTENTPELLRNIQSAASNVHANDWSDKSVLEILNGDAANYQEGDGALTYRLYKMTYSVFRSIYNQPSFKIKVEAVKDNSGGGGSGGTENTTNYEPILNKRTAGEIFAYNLNFDESLPHSDETAVYVGNERYAYKQYVWDSTAKYSLYYKYLLNMIKLWPNDININSCSDTKPENGNYFKNSINQWCSINIAGSLTNKDLGIDIREYIVSTAEESRYQLKKGTFDQVLEWFKKETSYEGIPEGAYANGQVGDDDELDPVDPDPGGDPCYTNSGSLGWIVCPVINWLGDTLKSLYSQMVEPLLVVKSELFNGGDNSATYQAWEIFRNIANVMFVILFLVVIFSQLTGVGIDNYGIKKILPKLIVAAVLINLSYIICQLAVDLSNIAGAGLNNLFTNQAGKLSGLSGDFTSGVWFKHVLNILLGVLIGGGVAGVVLTVVGEGLLSGLILPLLMGLIVAFVAVVFFFALLGMRQAGVVVLVVVAPVAFACYMLPNTKKIFDRWLKIFQGLLLLYPICGLLVGGSTLASAILVSNSKNFFIYMIGLLLMVVPFFFIPILLKSSFAAMGNIGAKISGWGSRLGKSVSGRADKGIRNSNAFKNSQELAAERRTRIRAGIGKDGKARKVSGFGKFLRGGDRNMARARAQYLKNQDARNREENLMGVGFAAATIGQEKRAERDELADYMTLINNETRNGEDDVALGEMYNDYMQNGNKAGAVAVARIAGRRKDTAAAFLKNYVTNDSLTSGYNDVQREILRSVSKEVSTGENSGMYRESTPLGFEFAAQMNRGTAGTNSYSEWLGKQDERGSFANVHRAMENYITDTKQLVGAKGGSLREIGDLMGRDEMVTDENGNTTIQRHNQQMDAADLARVSTLATQAIENRDKPGASWDSTKAEELCRISGKYDYNRQTGEITLKPEYANAGSVNGGAAEGENFNVREASATVNEGAASGAGVGGGNTEFNVRSMDDDTLLDLATSPGVPNNSNLRTAAEQEYRRRNPGYVGGGINSGNGGQSNAQRNNIPTNIGGSGGADSVSE